MARTARVMSKNGWTLFLFILLGIVLGSFLGYLAKNVDFLSWLNYGFNFSLGDGKDSSVVTLNLLDVLVISFGIRIKITVGSIVGAIAAIFIYRKI
jgi:hypothetical protein